MEDEHVVLVDEQGNEIGTAGKMEAHQEPRTPHRALSVFVFDAQNHMLIQRRAPGKYPSPGLWSNTCCSHPRPGEAPLRAAHRRLREEMGFDTELTESFRFTYKASLANGLTEWEFDHVFIGTFDGPVVPDPTEVSEHRWVAVDELVSTVQATPEDFTPWFKLALKRVLDARQTGLE